MGGKNSLIILDDADLDLAASNAAWASFLHQGQICFAAGRTLVQRAVVDEFIQLAALAKAIRVGNPTEIGTELGPLISEAQCGRVSEIVRATRAAGASLHAGGEAKGLFFPPTVLSDVTPVMPAFRSEIFGPVASITRLIRPRKR